MYTDVSALLSPDQREELEAMRTQMQRRVESDKKRRAELQAAMDRQLKAEKAAADAEAKNAANPGASVPTAKPAEKGK
jgi:peptidoglycan hydrolase CwlO-like protein